MPLWNERNGFRLSLFSATSILLCHFDRNEWPKKMDTARSRHGQNTEEEAEKRNFSPHKIVHAENGAVLYCTVLAPFDSEKYVMHEN